MDGKQNNDGFEILDTTPEDIAHDIVVDLVENMPTTTPQLDGMAEEQEVVEQEDHHHDKTEQPDAKILKITPEELGAALATTTTVTTTLEKGASTESSNQSSELDNIYQVKWISWRSNRVPIITQNSNGPCPMLAIANILLLRGKMELQDGCEMVSSELLIERLGVIT